MTIKLTEETIATLREQRRIAKEECSALVEKCCASVMNIVAIEAILDAAGVTFE